MGGAHGRQRIGGATGNAAGATRSRLGRFRSQRLHSRDALRRRVRHGGPAADIRRGDTALLPAVQRVGWRASPALARDGGGPDVKGRMDEARAFGGGQVGRNRAAPCALAALPDLGLRRLAQDRAVRRAVAADLGSESKLDAVV
eukprot:3624139-Prymnesium_polylepis.2